jgi:peptidoglycan/xylan/chitin deacetylase (PgdA/CDA1 family)
MNLLLSLYQKVKEFKLKRYQVIGKILMFHQVDNNINNWNDENCSITFESFKNLINIFQNQGYKFISISDVYNCELPGKNLIITFDDGFTDTYKYAYPFLKKNNIPFCIFVVSSLIDKEGYVTKEELKKLSEDSICTIGAHSVTHPILRQVNDREAFNEIYNCKIELENMINKEIEYFAYPYGSIYACSRKNIINVERCGYKLAFSTLNSHISKKILKDRFFIPRINVNEKNYKKIGYNKI